MTMAAMMIGCQMSEMDTPYEGVSKLKTVTLSADMPSDDTKAALSTRNGHFSWQANDQISVLATDGKFYTLTLASGADTHQGVFSGQIPDGYTLTTVAAYPAFATDGSENTVYDAANGKLKYTIPVEYDYVDGNTNVPMVASVTEGSTPSDVVASFKQIGGVIRFPINAMPKEAKVVLTVKDIFIGGTYEVVPSEAGTTELKGQSIKGLTNIVTVNYSSDVAGRTAEVNFPVPTGVYKDFSIEVFDAEGKSLVKKDYNIEKTINRATLLIMDAIDAGPMTISEVWPFFVDARVLFSKFAGVEKYAIYIDDIKNPVVVRGEELDGNMSALIGGDFAHNSTHTIRVAKVVDGLADEATMSEPVTFTTGQIYQLTKNTGTRFVSVGWDDVAIGVENSTQYDPVTKQWTAVKMWDDCGRDRFYQVQLMDENNNILYDFIPVAGYNWWASPFSSSKWTAKIEASNCLLPPALSFGWLESGKDYYFRVKTIDTTMLGLEEGNHWSENEDDIPAYSRRGASAWSNKIKLTTDEVTPIEGNLIFHEGFDDITLNDDFMNWACAVVPDLSNERMTLDAYRAILPTKYPEFVASSPSPETTKWVCLDQDDTWNRADVWGLFENNFSNSATPRVLNSAAGSLEGWSITSATANASLIPGFGSIKLGDKNTNNKQVSLFTPEIKSDKLLDNRGTKAIIKVQVSFAASRNLPTDIGVSLNIKHTREGSLVSSGSYVVKELYPERWEKEVATTCIDRQNYVHINDYFEVEHVTYLRNGDVIEFDRPTTPTLYGALVISDIKIEIVPGNLEEIEGVTRNFGTAPDNTNYDVWGLGGAMLVTFWMGPPTLDQFNADAITADELANIKATYFDPIVQGGYNLIEICNPYPASMNILLQWCTEAGVKMIDKSIGDWTNTQTNVDRITQYANNTAYAGLFVGKDEPATSDFTTIANMNNAFMTSLSTKARTVNLFPDYASDSQLGVSGYENYVSAFANQIDMSDHKFSFMFDHYCLSKSDKYGNAYRGSVKSDQYYNLDVIRHYSLEKRVPFLQITHGRPQWDPGYSATIANDDPTWTTDVSATALPPKPDEHVYDEQRWLVWSQLALGSKGVSYFCYWTPPAFKGGPFSFHVDGTKTRMYDILKNINSEIQPIGKILMTCHADGAMTTNPSGRFVMYENSGNGLDNYGPVLSIAKDGSEDVIAGCFRDASTGEYKVLVTHKAPATTDSEAATASIAKLQIDKSMVTKVKLHTVTLTDHNSAATTVVSEQPVTGDELTLSIPDGTAVLVEFPETANVSYN